MTTVLGLLAIAPPVLVGVLVTGIVVVRPSFLDPMVRVQQRRMDRLLLAIREAAANGDLDRGSEWYVHRTRLLERYAESPTARLPSPTSLAFALLGSMVRRRGPATTNHSEHSFDARILALVFRVARYRSRVLWLVPSTVWSSWTRTLSTRFDPDGVLTSLERARTSGDASPAATPLRRRYRRQEASIFGSDPGF